jgi:tricorn protease
MSRHLVLVSTTLAALLAVPLAANAQTRMLRTPTVSKTQIAFAYANNIWTVDRSGGSARRLPVCGHDRESKVLAGWADAFSAVWRQRRRAQKAIRSGEPKRPRGTPVPMSFRGDARRKSIVFGPRATSAPSGAPRF